MHHKTDLQNLRVFPKTINQLPLFNASNILYVLVHICYCILKEQDTTRTEFSKNFPLDLHTIAAFLKLLNFPLPPCVQLNQGSTF